MKRRKRAVITIEADEVVRVTRGGRPLQAWCPGCRAYAPMLTPEEAVSLVKVSARTIYRWVEDEKVHYTESDEGHLLVCVRSLRTQK